jgi:hypothetical protein
MADTEDQDRRSVGFPQSDLTRRLLRRATASIGVIDVGRAAELHSRSSFRLGPTLELLGNFKTRYGLGQEAGAASTTAPVAGDMSLATPLLRAAVGRPDFASASASSNSVGSAATGTSLTSTDSFAPQYRVRRPERLAEPQAYSPLASEAAVKPAAMAVASPLGTISAPAAKRDTEQRRSSAGDTSIDSVLPLARAAAVAPARDVPRAASPLPQVTELPGIVTAVPSRVQRKLDDSSAAKSSAAKTFDPDATLRDVRPVSARRDLPPGGAAVPGNASDSGPTLQRKVEHPPATRTVAEVNDRAPASPEFSSPSAPPTVHADEAFASASPSADGLPLQRKADPSAVPPSTPDAPLHGPVAAEVRVAPLQANSGIVWRRSSTSDPHTGPRSPGVSASATHITAPQVMRQAVSEPASNGDAAAAPPVPQSNGADVEQIAEQVSRIISRRLRVERERWGGR